MSHHEQPAALPAVMPSIEIASTEGIVLQTRSRFAREAVELLSSMRFAISVLVVIAIASVIGTVIQQNQPMVNYVNQFGPFWFQVFERLTLYSVYTSGWFFVLLTFLVISTSLCIARNTPRFLREMRDMRADLREQSLHAFGHRLEVESPHGRTTLAQTAERALTARGFRITRREHEGATLLAAKAGSANRLGYICAHLAIVIMAVGYLIDTDLPIRAQMVLFGKTPVTSNGLVNEVPPTARFGPANMTFRGSALIPEGQSTDVAIVNWRNGAFVQDLPFTVQLKKFIVEYYPTGMPRLFRSEVTVTDRDTGKSVDANIEVNKPFIHRGIAIYQSSFDDGGSRLRLTGHPMTGSSAYSFPFEGNVGQSAQLTRGNGGAAYSVEFTGFRPINVENLAPEAAREPVDKRFQDHVAAVVSSTTKSERNKHLRNVGPSFQYKLRAADGTAREFSNYMLPIELEGRSYYLAGVRDTPSESFKFLRMPADRDGKLDEFMRLRAALQNGELRTTAAQRYAARALGAAQTELRAPLAASAQTTLELFAQRGFEAIAEQLEQRVPQAEQAQAAEVFMRILNGALGELWSAARERDGLSPIAADAVDSQWLAAATNALSDATFYNAPVLLTLDSFDHVQASVFQLTRSPGKNIVYGGCLLLVIGIFSMFYVHERRIWVWIKDRTAGAHLLMAMSAPRRTLDFEREFAQVRDQLAQIAVAQTTRSKG
ncbi:MAG TPA: cytochrome c biogenesis protein ResB [Burkholderiaceae bacterium]|nr:cytochrome c biogenesis protein ResB [Burkholderiaceae bacterium]